METLKDEEFRNFHPIYEYDTTYRYTVSYSGFSRDVGFELQRSDAGDVMRFVRTCVKLLNDTKSLKSSDYTIESWSLYEDRRDALECAIGEDEDDLDRLNDLKSKLEEAVDHLVKAEPAIDPPAVEPLENTLVVTPAKKTVKLKVKDLKKKAKVVKPFKIKTPVGKVTYKATYKGKAKKFLKFKGGKLTVKKGTKKGKYVVTLKVKAAGNEEFLPKTKSCKITVVVK